MDSALHENGHDFVPGADVGLKALSALVCKDCGIVRRGDGKNSQCRGRVCIELRSTAGADERQGGAA